MQLEFVQEWEKECLLPGWKVACNGVEVPLLTLGDSAYLLLEWLMKQYSDTGKLNREQLHFNYRLSHARIVVEDACGQRKGKWRRLLKRNDSSLGNVCTQIVTFYVLHNTCIYETIVEQFQKEWLRHVQGCALPQPTSTSMPQPARDQANRIRLALTSYLAKDSALYQ